MKIVETDFSWMDEPQRAHCEELQTKMLELEPSGLEGEALWQMAADQLGNDDERYCRIYQCEECGQLYHADYSNNPDEDHDFCGFGCQQAYGTDVDND